MARELASAPSAEERDVIKHLDRIDGEAEAYAEKMKFNENAEFWLAWRNGDQWPDNDEPVFMANIMGNLIERKLASLTQSKPDYRVTNRAPKLGATAEVLTKTSQAVLDENQLDARLERAGDLAATFGFVGIMTAWDPHAGYGRGDITITPIDARRIAVDRNIKDTSEINQAQYIRVDVPMPLAQVQRQWPGRGALVKADEELSSYKSLRRPASWFGGPLRRVLRPFSSVDSPYKWAIVSKYWIASEERSPEDAHLDFPAGRLIHRSGDVLLSDDPNPYWDGMWDLDVWDWRVNGDSYMGRSEVEELRKAQEAFIRLGDILIRNVFLNGSINIIGDFNALTPKGWKELESRAARVIRKNPGRELKWEAPPAYPPQYLQLLELLPKFMELLVGVPEASQGRRQPGVVAQSAVEGLQTAAEVLVRACARRLEYLLERIGQKVISRILQFYTSDRVMDILGPSAQWEEYVFERSSLLAIGKDGEQTKLDDLAPKERKRFFSNFRFRVTPLSSLPVNKIQRALLAKELYSLGVVDDEEVLKMSEWPDKENVLARTKKKLQEGQAERQKELMLHGGKRTRSNRSGTRLGIGS